ncbi:autoinducer binding domain-containing protein [Martelella alba]|uniref:LuxR family transcriptional regulator n=1 Tax=Martelella alba TaxID=2590451 RepID=A0ABY2SE67_9HYPH|nr:autoinducer binding domain-containing protein [Martelella alba]TKI02504.1 LuxR family transcriptional regulator [Martelella alba]
MNIQYSYFKEKTLMSQTDDNLIELIRNEMEFNSFKTYAYMRLNKHGQNVKLISTYPKQWLDVYLKGKYYNFDPVVQEAKLKVSPFLWNGGCVESNEIFEEARKYSILHGICFVAHRSDGYFSVFSICNRDNKDKFIKNIKEKESTIQMLLLKCFEEDIASETEKNCSINLTLRESEILKWLSMGKTYYEISMICSITERTVRFHVTSILNKLNVTNTKHALTKAALQGLLDE